jgi:hypothetical protein
MYRLKKYRCRLDVKLVWVIAAPMTAHNLVPVAYQWRFSVSRFGGGSGLDCGGRRSSPTCKHKDLLSICKDLSELRGAHRGAAGFRPGVRRAGLGIGPGRSRQRSSSTGTEKTSLTWTFHVDAV